MKWVIGIGLVVILGIILAVVLRTNNTKSSIINSEPKNSSLNAQKKPMKITSSAFEDNGQIPSEYTCDGQNLWPEITINDVSVQAQSLALVMDDPDAPNGTFTHWILYNIPPTTLKIESGIIPFGSEEATNSFGKKEYGGPCPPSGTHRYFFTLYALDRKISIPQTATVDEVKNLISANAIDKTTLTGLYSKK